MLMCFRCRGLHLAGRRASLPVCQQWRRARLGGLELTRDGSTPHLTQTTEGTGSGPTPGPTRKEARTLPASEGAVSTDSVNAKKPTSCQPCSTVRARRTRGPSAVPRRQAHRRAPAARFQRPGLSSRRVLPVSESCAHRRM